MSIPLSPTRPRLVLHKGSSPSREPTPEAGASAHRWTGPQHPTTRAIASLTLDGLPHALFDRIVESAAANHRSLVGEVIARLESALGSSRPTATSMLARVRAVRSRMAVRTVSRGGRRTVEDEAS